MATTQLNPYLNRRPVTEPNEFHGRETIVAELLQRLVTSTSEPQCCLLLGMRRVGKSSLLNFLKHPRGARARVPAYFPAGSKVVMVTIDTVGLSLGGAEEEPFDVRMLRAMARGLAAELAPDLAALPAQSPTARALRELIGEPGTGRFRAASAGELYEALEGLHETLHDAGYRTLYLFDGVDDQSKPWPEPLATRLRYYFNNYSVAYVIASLKPMTAVLEGGQSSELYNVFNTVIIGPLMEGAAVELLRDPLHEKKDEGWSDAFLRAMLEEVGTHPDLLKMAAARAWSLRDASGGEEPAIETVLEAVGPDIERLFESLYKRLDDAQKSEVGRAEPNLAAAMLASHNAVAHGARLGRRFHEWARQRGPAAERPTLEGNRLSLEGRTVELTPIEQQLVSRLLAHHGHAVSRQALQAEIWSGHGPKSKALDTTVQRLRDKLGDDRAEPRWILTVRGHGYAFGPMQGNA